MLQRIIVFMLSLVATAGCITSPAQVKSGAASAVSSIEIACDRAGENVSLVSGTSDPHDQVEGNAPLASASARPWVASRWPYREGYSDELAADFEAANPLSAFVGLLTWYAPNERQLILDHPIFAKIKALSGAIRDRVGIRESEMSAARFELLQGSFWEDGNKEGDTALFQPSVNTAIFRRDAVTLCVEEPQEGEIPPNTRPYTIAEYITAVRRGFQRFGGSTGFAVSFACGTSDFRVRFEAPETKDDGSIRTALATLRDHQRFQGTIEESRIGAYRELADGTIVFFIHGLLEELLPRHKGVPIPVQKDLFLSAVQFAAEHELKHAIMYGGNITHPFVVGHSFNKRSIMYRVFTLDYRTRSASDSLGPDEIVFGQQDGIRYTYAPVVSPQSEISGKAIRLVRALFL